MDDLETRELRYFEAIAEELNFGRAARRLGIAQPPLSRAIARLERRLGVTLLERTSRHVALTAAGEVFRRESRKALDAMAAAARRTRRAARPDPGLVLVTKADADAGLLTPILADYAATPAAVPVEVLVCGVAEQAGILRDGRADVALLHLPWDDTAGLDTEPLRTEDQVVVLPVGHRLARRPAVTLADLAGETLPRWPGVPSAATGPEIRDNAQLMQLIALGRTVAVLPGSVRTHLRDDLTCVPVPDAAPTTVVLAWPERSHSRPLAAFVRSATATAAAADRPAATAS